jgi:MoxR-like ATPase
VTAGGHTYTLPKPFLVFATQNPIEQEGTYPLPEAQQDRFMFSIPVGYPSAEEEEEIVRRTTAGALPKVQASLSVAELLEIQAVLKRTPIPDDVVAYAVALARATRGRAGDAPVRASRWMRWGAGPRASQFLAVGARTWAALHGRSVATLDDVRAVAVPVLRHRVVLDFEAEASGLTVDAVLEDLLAEVR